MIVGSGLLAKAFTARFAGSRDVCVYAAGVSNSGCRDPSEFVRERNRLSKALDDHAGLGTFLYFSTCSVADPAALDTPYVRHKVAMEGMVEQHAGFIIARLPQIAGNTPNPHTLLNYFYARVSRSERFAAWKHATRNVIDVDDVEKAVSRWVDWPDSHKRTINVANPQSHSVSEIVFALEKETGKSAEVDWKDMGTGYSIDTRDIAPVYVALDLTFGIDYLPRVIHKYYGS